MCFPPIVVSVYSIKKIGFDSKNNYKDNKSAHFNLTNY